jgi:tRNA nucleotidyltransferase (CCA-adding enzyme)
MLSTNMDIVLMYNKSMRVILTHEQADFDALAAMLGASLLDETAYPVLPARINRNARAFLNLYGSELPFVEFRDLPHKPIEIITLVDTQSLVTLKGFSAETKVNVVDHHQLRPDLPAAWQKSSTETGACTTIFVEHIRERNGNLNFIHATMLLIGIYEDTGSLLYANTTLRDVQAVSFLFEQGASLRIAAEFLNPPLSDDQRKLYDRLLDSTETLNIHGTSIIIAQANAVDMSEEISSVAHKMRDLLDPDALILLVNTSEGIRMIARSTSDRVDVSKLAAHFKGGGHERAAAALIHPKDSEKTGWRYEKAIKEVQADLVNLLPSVIKPAVTVGQIMSRRPKLISPHTSVAEAARMMQHFGYEGYPVVDGNQIMGLLTRRAVDRALAHKLDISTTSLMESGEVSVRPDDSLDQLQAVMADTGWGQIPVIDEESGKVIGIVTRTDVLKTIASKEDRSIQDRNLARKLESALSLTRLGLIKLIATNAHDLHMPVYIVGGFVRDLILNRPSTDLDIVVEGDAIALAKTLHDQYGGRVISHGRFGTAKWQLARIHDKLLKSPYFPDCKTLEELPGEIDLISSRTEFYEYPTALPTVERGSIKLDLHRRDFTINTMALRLDGRHYGELYDYWGGQGDLKNGLVRVLHSLSFVDDPTRLLRAVRFEQRFDFQIESRTLQLMKEARPLLKQVSGIRIRHELDQMIEEKHALNMFARLNELDLLVAIHPTLIWSPDIDEALVSLLNKKPDTTWNLPSAIGREPIRVVLFYLVWFSFLERDSSLQLAERLRMPKTLITAIIELHEALAIIPKLKRMKPSEITQKMTSFSSSVLCAINFRPLSNLEHDLIENLILKWRKIEPTVDGGILRKLGIEPGPVYRQILDALKAGWIDGKIKNHAEEEKILAELLKEHTLNKNPKSS